MYSENVNSPYEVYKFSAGIIYLFKVNNSSTRRRWNLCSKLAITFYRVSPQPNPNRSIPNSYPWWRRIIAEQPFLNTLFSPNTMVG